MFGTVSTGEIMGEFCEEDEGLNDGARGELSDTGAAGAGDAADAGRDDCWTGRGRPAGRLNGLLS